MFIIINIWVQHKLKETDVNYVYKIEDINGIIENMLEIIY